MNPQPSLIILALSMALTTGCGPDPGPTVSSPNGPSPITKPSPSQSSQPERTPVISVAKPQMPALAPIAGAPKLTEESLKAIERRYACTLPTDYREFLLSNNGCFPSPDCVSFEEGGGKTTADVFCFFVIGDGRASLSLDWHHHTYSGRLPENTLPIGRDSCGNLWLVSLRGVDAGSIFFWDHGSYDTVDETDLDKWPKVASSFQEFLGKITAYDASSEAATVPSRYSLVKQAVDGMVNQDSEFSTRANPEFVWHCDCDDAGNVRMQFVQYEVHARTTHTCGYARLRAINGLIEAGPPRLPK